MSEIKDDLFLRDASASQLEEAAAANQREWMVLKARAAGGEVHESEGVAWTYAGPDGEAMVLFPRLAAPTADEQIDAVIAFYRQHPPKSLVGCWSLDPPQPADLEIRLLARGFQLGWQPHWMALDLERLTTGHAAPEGLRIELVDEAPDWDVRDLPYHSQAAAVVRHAASRLEPRQVWHFGAFLDGKPVGQSTLCLTNGPLGVAGLYDIGVVPRVRRRGIGKAVTAAACRRAKEMGARYALLNATGERMYRQLGFKEVGYGLTWWLDVGRLNSRPPTAQQIALAEAVGRGDLQALARLEDQVTLRDLETPLTNEMSLMEVAVHADQQAAIEWLSERGVKADGSSA